MRNGFLLLGALVLLATSTAQAEPKLARAKSKVSFSKCPTYIGNNKTKQFVKSDGLVCSNTSMKKAGMKETEVLVKGRYTFLDGFDAAGSGSGNSPAFSVGKKPALVTYSFPDDSGKGSFKLSVVDITTDKVVASLASVRGNSGDGSTYLHKQGGFYLKVDATPSVRVCEKDEGSTFCEDIVIEWNVAVTFEDEEDSFDFDF
jgi:hypothetical protein